ILMYLTPGEGDAMLAAIGGLSTPESRLALEHAGASGASGPVGAALSVLARLGTPWKSAINDPATWLAGHGWTASVNTAPDLADRYGRKVPRSTTSGWLVEAVRAGDDPD